MKKILLVSIFSWLLTGTIQNVSAQEEKQLFYPQLVDTFYRLNQDHLFWFRAGPEAAALRLKLPELIDSARQQGLVAERYHMDLLKSKAPELPDDTAEQRKLDRYFTDAALALSHDIFRGYKEQPWVGYDAVSGKYDQADGEKLVQCLLQATTAPGLAITVSLLEPADSLYTVMKQEYRRHQKNNRPDSVRFVRLTMNYYRWVTHFHFDRMIVINLPAARLFYYEQNKLVLQMKTVLGKPSTPSPRFAAWCDQAILYPYWYVPRSITFNEYLPIIKQNPSWLDAKNMQVIDGNGRVVNHHQLNWSSFHTGYFPYTIRQSTGCDNALGVIKFNINTPYGVYLHDTNNKSAFLSASRYFSHGCIRLEDPFDLGYHLLEHKLDTAFLQSCYKQQKPVFDQLTAPVPVFTVYMPAWPGPKGNVIYYKDVYRLLK